MTYIYDPFAAWLLEGVVWYENYIAFKGLAVSYILLCASMVMILLWWFYRYAVLLIPWLLEVQDKCYAWGLIRLFIVRWDIVALPTELATTLLWWLVAIVSWLGLCCPDSWLYLPRGMLVIVLGYLIFGLWFYNVICIPYPTAYLRMGFELFLSRVTHWRSKRIRSY